MKRTLNPLSTYSDTQGFTRAIKSRGLVPAMNGVTSQQTDFDRYIDELGSTITMLAAGGASVNGLTELLDNLKKLNTENVKKI